MMEKLEKELVDVVAEIVTEEVGDGVPSSGAPTGVFMEGEGSQPPKTGAFLTDEELKKLTKKDVTAMVQEFRSDIIRTFNFHAEILPKSLRYELRMQVGAMFKKLWKDLYR